MRRHREVILTTMYKLIDTHAHLDEVEDLYDMIERAKEHGLVAVIAVGMDYESNYRTLEIAEQYKSFVFPALGMHPQELGDTSEIERNLQFIEANIHSAVAIGEIGLDYHKKVVAQANKETQKQALREVLSIANRFAKPISVHSRYSWRDCFTVVHESGIEKAVFHWYSGPSNVLCDFLARGYLASATLAVEYGEEHRRMVKTTPLEQLMLETDTPVVYRWRTELAHPAEPADIARIVVGEVSRLKGVEPTVTAAKTTENAVKFFGLPNFRS